MLPGTGTADVASSFYPARGLYSSSNRTIVHAQMEEIAAAGVQEVVSSWWGWGSPEDLAAAARDPGGHARQASRSPSISSRTRSRTIASTEADIDHLRADGDHPLLRLPAVRPRRLRLARAAARRSTVSSSSPRPSLAGQGEPRAGFDGIYTYDILTVRRRQVRRVSAPRPTRSASMCLPSVGPGYRRAPARPATSARQAAPRRQDLRLDVDGGRPLERRRRDDHELQRVARGDADRAGAPAAADGRDVDLPGLRRRVRARAARRPRTPTSTAHGIWSQQFLRSRTSRPWQV